MQSEPDPSNMAKNRVFFNKKHKIKGVKPHAGHNLIMEFQVRMADASSEVRFASIGWTLINLFSANYELNIGQFKVPLYKTPTEPEIDIRDLGNLTKLDKSMFCLRIAIPKTSLAQLKIEPGTHPSHYQIPKNHLNGPNYEAKMGGDADIKDPEKQQAMMKKEMEEEKLQQESYECSGINVFVHFVKNYEPSGFIRVRCTLYEGPILVRDNNGKACQWSSRIIHPEEAIVPNQNNLEKLQKMGVYIYSEAKYGKKDIVVPVNDDKSWLRDFYKMIWDNDLKNDLYLMVELMVKENPYTGGTFKNLAIQDPDTVIQEYTTKAATMIKCSNFDGTIRYGSYEIPFFQIPLDRAKPSNNVELPYLVKVTVGQPVNQPENVPSDLFDGRNAKPESLFRKPNGFKDETDFPKRNPNADNPDPFIVNEKNQVSSELFKKDDIVILYIDSARFLPENVSYTRVVFSCYTSTGELVVNRVIAPANIPKSTGQMPFYGFRHEIELKFNPNMNPTMIGVFQIETIDRSNGEQRTVGFAFFPFFFDKNIKSPISNAKEKNFVLQNGNYQLPLFSEKPDLTVRPIKIENLVNLQKVP